MEVANAVGSLRFRSAVGLGGFSPEEEAEKEENSEFNSESLSEALELLFEEARSTAGNSSFEGVGEALWYCLCFRGFLDGRLEVELGFKRSSRLRLCDAMGAMSE